MKKILSVILALLLLTTALPTGILNITVSAATSGATGDCTWTLDGTVLTISGNGGMHGYCYKSEYGDLEYEELPWGKEITDVYIQEGVTRIGDACFYQCSNLKNITIAKSVTYIGNKAFDGCNGLENVYIYDIGAWCNLFFSSSVSNPLHYATNLYLNKKLLNEILVPNGVTEIKDYAFMYSKLISITLPNTVDKIGNYAFRNCKNLKYINIPNQVKTIGNYAFNNADALTNITIPESVVSIGDGAFAYCDSILDINITKKVKSIGKKAFAGCSNLKSITVDENNEFFSSVDGVLYNKDKTNLIICPCAKSGDLTIPESVKIINSTPIAAIAAGDIFGAFDFCLNIENIFIPNSVEIAEFQFLQFKAKNIVLQEGFTTIGQNTFYGCSTENITMPKSIKKIEPSAFWHSVLEEVWYTGSEEDRDTIDISNNNDVLLNATWHYNTCDYYKHSYSSDSDSTCNKCEWERKCCKHKYTNNCDTGCNVCGATRKITHSYKTTTTKATLENKGKIVKKCSACDKTTTSTINKIKSVTLSTTTYTYNGKTKKPTVTVKDSSGKKLTEDKDYTVTYPSGRKNVGTYKVKVKFKGDYSGTETLSFKIKAVKSSKLKLTLSKTSYTYNGKAKNPTVTVKDSSGKKLTEDKDYTVTYPSGRKKVGSYKVKIKFKGNYSGTEYLTFKINPKATTVSKVTAAKKSLKVKIKKQSSQTTGYEIQYSISKKFTKSTTKTKTVKNTTTSVTLKSLKANKKYYVRVRTYKTVDGKKYYSSWSDYKSKKTKK